MIQLYRGTPKIDESLPWLFIEKDWFGKEISSPPGFCLFVDEHFLYFCICSQLLEGDEARESNPQFAKGLYQDQVGELFLRNRQGEYLEAHLSSGSRWWLASFRSYRELSQELPGVEVVLSERLKNIQYLAIPLFVLEAHRLFPFEEVQFQASFIIGPKKKQYVTSGVPNLNEPDFHLPELFLSSVSVLVDKEN